MNLKSSLINLHRGIIIHAAIAVLCLFGAPVSGASVQSQQGLESGELYGGIDLVADGARAIAIRIYPSGEEAGLKLVYSEIIHFAFDRTSAGDFKSQSARGIVVTVKKLLTRLREEYRVPDNRIYLVGSSQIGAGSLEDLVRVVAEETGKTLIVLDAVTEVQLNIAGTIPQRNRVGDTWVDNRNSSVLIEVNSNSTMGGYQLLGYSPPALARYEFATLNIPYGVASFTNEIRQSLEENGSLLSFVQRAQTLSTAFFRKSLQQESRAKPGLLTRKRVYLAGDIVWALATLLYPEERGNVVLLTANDIRKFAEKAIFDPVQLLNPRLPRTHNRELSPEIERELESVRETFTPQQIVAGAEILKAVATELNLDGRSLCFARYGYLSRILSYVRLQAGK